MAVVDDAIARARTRLDIGRPEEALRIVEQELASAPDQPDLWETKARAHLQAKQPEAAVEAGRRALSVGGDRYSAHAYLAMALLDCGRAVEVLDSGEAMIRSHPEHQLGHMVFALAMAARYSEGYPGKDHLAERARASAARAVELAPDDVLTREHAGLVHRWIGDHRTAIRHLREVVRLSPDNTWALTQLAVVQSQRGRKIEALRYVRAVLAIDPRNFTVLRAAYGECRKFTRSLIVLSVFLGLLSLIMVAAATDEPGAGTLRAGFSVLTTGCLGFTLFRIWRVPASIRRFLVNRRWGTAWAGSVLLAPLSVLAISWLPVPYAAAPFPLLIIAVIAYLILTGVVDRDALARFAAGEFPQAEQRAQQDLNAAGRPPVAADPGIRLGAFLVDGLVAGSLGIVTFFLGMFTAAGVVLGFSLPDGQASMVIGMGCAAAGALAAVFCYFWLSTASSGQTFGKRAMSIRTIDLTTGRPPSMKAAAGRTALLFGFGLLPVVGFLADFAVMLRDRPYYRGARDELVNTWVIRA